MKQWLLLVLLSAWGCARAMQENKKDAVTFITADGKEVSFSLGQIERLPLLIGLVRDVGSKAGEFSFDNLEKIGITYLLATEENLSFLVKLIEEMPSEIFQARERKTDWSALQSLTKEKNKKEWELDSLHRKKEKIEKDISQYEKYLPSLTKLKGLDPRFFKFQGELTRSRWEPYTKNKSDIENQKKEKEEIEKSIKRVQEELEKLSSQVDRERERIREESKRVQPLDFTYESGVIQTIDEAFKNKAFVFCLQVILLANYLMIHQGIQDAMIGWLLQSKKPTQNDIEFFKKMAIPKSIALRLVQHYLHLDEVSEIKKVALIDTWNNEVIQEDLENFDNIRTAKDNEEIITCMFFSADTSLLATGHSSDKDRFGRDQSSGTIKIWNFKDTQTKLLEKLETPEKQYTVVTAVSLSPDGTFLSAGLSNIEDIDDYLFVIYDMQKKEWVKKQKYTTCIVSIVFDPSSKKLIFTRRTPFLYLWQYDKEWLFVKEFAEDEYWKLGNSARDSINFSPNGLYLASAGGTCVTIWDARNWQTIKTFKDIAEISNNIGFSPDGNQLIYMSQNGYVLLYDIFQDQERNIEYAQGYQNNYGKALLFSLNPRYNSFITGRKDAALTLWDFDSEKSKKIDSTFLMTRGGIKISALSFSSDGNYLVWSFDKYLSVVQLSRTLDKFKRLASRDLMDFLYEQAKKDFKTTSEDVENFLKNKKIEEVPLKTIQEKEDIEESSNSKNLIIENNTINIDEKIEEEKAKEIEEDLEKKRILKISKIGQKDKGTDQESAYNSLDIDRARLEERLEKESVRKQRERRRLEEELTQEERELPVGNLNQMLQEQLDKDIKSKEDVLSWREWAKIKYRDWKDRLWRSLGY